MKWHGWCELSFDTFCEYELLLWHICNMDQSVVL